MKTRVLIFILLALSNLYVNVQSSCCKLLMNRTSEKSEACLKNSQGLGKISQGLGQNCGGSPEICRASA